MADANSAIDALAPSDCHVRGVAQVGDRARGEHEGFRELRHVLCSGKNYRKRKMFGFGNKKDKLQAKYQKLMQESFDLSTVNRELSDRKRAEAESIGQQLDELKD